MFEPKTYFEKRTMILEGLLVSVISALPPECIQHIQQPYNQYLNQVSRLKTDLTEEVLGPVEFAEADRPQKNWILKLLAENLGRTVFNNKIKGSELEGAIGTKSFGQKYVPWLKSLPVLGDSWGPDMATGFYVDNRHVQPGTNDLPTLTIILRARGQLILIAIRQANYYVAQLYLDHVAPDFKWQYAGEEFTQFRADITKEQFAAAFGEALITQGRPTLAVEPSLVNLPLIAALSLDVVATSESEEVAPITNEERAEADAELQQDLAEDFAAEKAMIEGLANNAMPTEVAEGLDAATAQAVEIAEAAGDVDGPVDVAEGVAAGTSQVEDAAQ